MSSHFAHGFFPSARAPVRPLRTLGLLLACTFADAGLPDAAPAQVPADSARVFDIAEVDSVPRPVNVAALRDSLAAAYPPGLRQAAVGGTVVVSFVVGADGNVRDAAVVRSTQAALDAPTLAALAVLRFAPARLGPRAVPVGVELPIEWAPPPLAAAVEPVAVVVADSGHAFQLSEVDEEPRPLNMGELRRALAHGYPIEMRQARMSGIVQIRMRVDRTGMPRDLQVTRSTDRRLDQATLESIVQTLRFAPGKLNGHVVDVWLELPVHWQVNP
jgi:TonB family protein